MRGPTQKLLETIKALNGTTLVDYFILEYGNGHSCHASEITIEGSIIHARVRVTPMAGALGAGGPEVHWIVIDGDTLMAVRAKLNEAEERKLEAKKQTFPQALARAMKKHSAGKLHKIDRDA